MWTSLPLPSLPPAERAGQSELITIHRINDGAPTVAKWLHHWLDDGHVTLSLARDGDDYWLRSPGIADFLLQMESRRVRVAAEPDVDAATLEHLLVDQVLPRLLAHHGHLLIHASALATDGRCALFMGPSGWGKSTLAGLLQRHGHIVLSDDCVLLAADREHFQAVATYPSLRLYEDSLTAVSLDAVSTTSVAAYSKKRRLPMPAPRVEGAGAVAALYLLGDPEQAGEAINITPLGPTETCQALLRHSFRLDLTNRDANAHQFALCGAAARALPAFRLNYPRDFAQADELVRRISNHLATVQAKN